MTTRKGPVHPAPLAQPNKGKEPILKGESNPPTDDKLSSDSSPLLACSPPQNNAKAESKKRPPCRSSQSISGVRRRVLRETSRDMRPLELAPVYMPIWPRVMAPQFPPVHHPFGVASAPHLVSFPTVRRLEDMLSSPLSPHILSYDHPGPPCSFVMPSFSIYDGSIDPYDHMLHFNQIMILSAGNDRLMCKVFPTSLKGPALAWFHIPSRGSINSFSDLWITFISQYLCSIRQKGNISSL